MSEYDPRQASAEAFAREVELLSFSAHVEQVERDEDPWDVAASTDMVPTCENITETEELLQDLAQAHQGRADGWVSFASNQFMSSRPGKRSTS